MKKYGNYRPEVGLTCISISIILILTGTPGFLIAGANNSSFAQASEEGLTEEVAVLERKVLYEEESYSPGLPELELTDSKNYFKTWTRREYGVDENPYGIIGSAVVTYSFRTPGTWSVKITSRRFASGEDMIIFRLTGESGIWGSITKVNLRDKSIKSGDEFARYYTRERPSFMALLGDLKDYEVDSKLHLIQGFSSTEGSFVEHYESYSSVEIRGREFASIAGYELRADLGYVVDIYIPLEEFNSTTRTMAYALGKSFTVYRFL